jgi:hypothetical protein
VPIETTAIRWDYALVLQLEAQPPHGSLAIEVGVQVMDGKLGVAAGGEDPSRFCSPERTLAAMLEPQRIVIKAQSKEIHSLIFRNIAPEGTKTVFKVLGIEARRSAGPSPLPLSGAV